MPFRVQIFQENVERLVGGTARAELVRICEEYAGLTTPRQKTQSIHTMMTELDMLVMEETRQDIMEMCGRRCIGTSTLQKARQLKQAATSLDDWLDQLNNAHIGGGHLWREGNIIHAKIGRASCRERV